MQLAGQAGARLMQLACKRAPVTAHRIGLISRYPKHLEHGLAGLVPPSATVSANDGEQLFQTQFDVAVSDIAFAQSHPRRVIGGILFQSRRESGDTGQLSSALPALDAYRALA